MRLHEQIGSGAKTQSLSLSLQSPGHDLDVEIISVQTSALPQSWEQGVSECDTLKIPKITLIVFILHQVFIEPNYVPGTILNIEDAVNKTDKNLGYYGISQGVKNVNR